MIHQPSSGPEIFRATNITDIMSDVLNHLLARTGSEGEGMFTLVFAGEAATMEDALRDAIGDIQGLAADHGGIPIDIKVDAVVRTDEGTRMWGSVSCVPGKVETMTDPAALTSQITIHQEGPRVWTLTLGRN